VVHIFDKDPPVWWPNTVPAPYCTKNPPPLVRTITFFILYLFYDRYICVACKRRIFTPIVRLMLKLSDGNNNVLKELAGDDADGGGATSSEHVAPNPIDSNLLGKTHPSVVDQVKATGPSDGGQNQKCPPPVLKCKQSKPSVDQVMTQIELPSYHGP
jgi:hypothetical protein